MSVIQTTIQQPSASKDSARYRDTTGRRRLGFPVRILGDPDLRSHDGRRLHNNPHLSMSLLYLRDILLYLQQHGIGFYRLSDSFAPYLTHPDRPQFHRQLEQCQAELAAVGAMARAADIRLSLHLRSHVALSTPDEQAAERLLLEIEAQSALLTAMGLSEEGVVVAHVGAHHGNSRRALQRFAARFERLTPQAACLLAVEHDQRFSLNDTLHLHARTGIPVVFDHLHHLLYDPQLIDDTQALEYALQTWPAGRTPKIHLSSPRTELRIVERANAGSRRRARFLEPPSPNEHSDYLHPFEAIRLLRAGVRLRPFDIMLEAKAGDLALLRLRQDLRRFAPDLAAWIW